MVLPIIAQVGIPVLVKGLGRVIPNKNHLGARASAALSQLGEAMGEWGIPDSQLGELHRHLEKLQEIESGACWFFVSQFNESLRAEISSNDPYVRRMRLTFGYIIAFDLGVQMMSLAYVVVSVWYGQVSIVIDAVAELGTIWAVGLSVLGILCL